MRYLWTVCIRILKVLWNIGNKSWYSVKGDINHIARIITYVDIKKWKSPKLISLLTNDFDMSLETIVAIYHRRWQIESLFKQIK